MARGIQTSEIRFGVAGCSQKLVKQLNPEPKPQKTLARKLRSLNPGEPQSPGFQEKRYPSRGGSHLGFRGLGV